MVHCTHALTLTLHTHTQVPRTEWVLKWPGQVVIAGCQTYWTSEVSQALEEGVLPDLFQKMLGQVSVWKEGVSVWKEGVSVWKEGVSVWKEGSVCGRRGVCGRRE